MGIYVHTLRTKSFNSTVGQIHPCHYLCRSSDLDTWDRNPATNLLQAQVDAAGARWEKKWGEDEAATVNFVLTSNNDCALERADTVWRGPADKAAVLDDYTDLEKAGFERVGLLNCRERHGRKLVWTIMTEAQEAAHMAEQERLMREGAERYKREKAEAEAKRQQEAIERQRKEQARKIAEEQAAEIDEPYQRQIEALQAEHEAARTRIYNDAMIAAGYAPEEGGS